MSLVQLPSKASTKSLGLIVSAIAFVLCAPGAWGQSPFGSAIDFNGTNQYVSVPNFGNIIPTNEITVEFWANTTVTGGQSAFILNPDAGNNRFNVHINYGPPPAQGVTYWDFGNISGNGRLGPIPADVNSVGNWVHYAFVASQSGNYMSIYTNGVLMATRTGMTPFVRGPYDLHIGGSSNFFSYHGSIDEFRVWNVARSQAQIQADLGVPLSGAETNLVVYYRFDSTNGTLAVNSATATGAAYNGTLVNGPAWMPSAVGAATLLNSMVTSAADTGPGTLRQTMASALPGTTITFAGTLAGHTIALSSGELFLDKNLTIDGSALSGGMVLDGQGLNRIFEVSQGVSNCLTGLTITNGNSGGDQGGGIFNAGMLQLNQCTVISNTTTASGGGILNVGAMIVNDCAIIGNSSVSFGYGGGGIANNGALTVNQSTFTRNSANGGGAIFSGTGTTLAVFQSTIVSNVAFCCGGGVTLYSSTGVQILMDSIVAGNSNQDLFFAIGAAYTVFNHNFTNGNPAVTPLANYGGPTPTMALLSGSPAIDAGGLVDEVQQLTVSGPAGSTFSLTFMGAVTPPLSVTSTAAQVQSALNALPPISSPGGTVAVTVANGVYTITFGGALAGANQPQLSASGFGGANSSVSTVLDGMPLPAFDQRGPGFPRVFNSTVDIGAYEFSSDIAAGGVNVTGTEGTPTGEVPVATFTSLVNGATAADFAAVIGWGDGTPASLGTITQAPNGTFSVLGNHTYAEEGSYSISVTITNSAASASGVTAASTAIIMDAPLTVIANYHLTGPVGEPLPFQTVATFTDPGGAESTNDYIALVDWGDGLPPLSGMVLITQTGDNQFTVVGSHTYSAVGNYQLTVSLFHESSGIEIYHSDASIVQANSMTTVVPSKNSPVYGQSVTYTLTVSAESQNLLSPTGTMQVIVDGNYFGSPIPFPPSGQATTTLPVLSAGPHYVAAAYGGDVNFLGSLGITNFVISKASTFTAVASSVNPSSPGQPVTFTADVSAIAPGSGTPTGSVQFMIDGTNIGGSVPLNGIGRATITDPALTAVGSPHTVAAQYSGDANFNAGSGTLAGGQALLSNVTTPLLLAAPTKHTNGAFGFTFTNATGASFTVLASTNPAIPLSAWSNLGTASEVPPGSGYFQFTDPQATNNPHRFYRVRSP